MKKRVIALLLIVALVASLCVGLAACNNDDEEFKIGLICLHDENSTYDLNFINAMKEVQKELGLKDSQVIIVTNIPESEKCYEAAANLVDKGCDIVFADSFGHETYMIQAAKDFPDVQFCHATGVNAAKENLDNFADAFASIYEGRYLVGIAAGMKLKALYGDKDGNVSDADAKIGYVGAFTYAEVVSGYSSFFLGVKSIVPNVTMDVKFTGSWYDETAEKEAANALIQCGAKLISQHADSMGAPTACKNAGIPNVTYNVSTADSCADTFIAASRINWAPYYKYVINQVKNGEKVAHDWVGTLATDSVQVIGIGTAAAPGTSEALATAKAALSAGTLQVFDTTKFEVAVFDETGKTITGYKALTSDSTSTTAIYDAAVVDGIYKESSAISAPGFAYQLKGITLLNTKF